ncbi:unnamed protein product, partial [Rotaria magnacalcarata]
MDMLSKGSIQKIIHGEELDLPIMLLVEEACVLYLNTDSSSESGTANIRLRLTDSIDSFSGFVCKTKQVNELKSGVLLSIEAFHMESLGNNKVVCKIVNMTIIREIQGVNAKETNGSIVDSSRDKSDSSTPQQQLLLINLGDVDLGSGKKRRILLDKKNDILAVKYFRLRFYNKKIVLNSTMDSEIFLNPDCKEADKLRSLIASPILNNSETTNFNTKCFVDMGQNMSLNEDLIHSMKKMRLNNSNVESIKNKNAGVFRILDLTPPCSPFRKQSDGEYDV